MTRTRAAPTREVPVRYDAAGDADGRLSSASLWSDTGFVLVAGPAPWWQDQPPGAIERFIVRWMAWIAVAVGLAVVSFGDGGWLSGSLVIGGFVVLVAPPAVWMRTGGWITSTSPVVVIPVRLVAAIALAVGFVRSGLPEPVVALAAGAFFGIDASLSLRGVGQVVGARRALLRFASSGLHLGVVVGIAATVLASDRVDDPVFALRRYLLLWGTATVGIAMIATFQSVGRDVGRERTVDLRQWQSEEHRRRAHWIHDDVCAELRYVRIQLEQGELATEGLGPVLDDLDHRLRLRQLDELLDSGSVRLGEVVQPFVRTMQDRRVRILAVPGFDVADRRLAAVSARRLRRVLGVLVPNALHAGATAMGIRCSTDGVVLHVEVEDDAGGFDLAAIEPGRGLDTLRDELGAAAIVVRSTDHGSTVCADLRLEDLDDEPAARR